MKLSKLVHTDTDVEIKGVTADSREVKKGFLFGSLNDDAFIKDAVKNGAAAVIVPADYAEKLPKGVAVI